MFRKKDVLLLIIFGILENTVSSFQRASSSYSMLSPRFLHTNSVQNAKPKYTEQNMELPLVFVLASTSIAPTFLTLLKQVDKLTNDDINAQSRETNEPLSLDSFVRYLFQSEGPINRNRQSVCVSKDVLLELISKAEEKLLDIRCSSASKIDLCSNPILVKALEIMKQYKLCILVNDGFISDDELGKLRDYTKFEMSSISDMVKDRQPSSTLETASSFINSVDPKRHCMGETSFTTSGNAFDTLFRQLQVFQYLVSTKSLNLYMADDNRVKEVKLLTGPHSFFYSTTCEHVSELLPIINELEQDVDAIELRADLLSNHSDLSILSQLSLLRSHTHLPIIFTVRSLEEGGAISDRQLQQHLINLALRAGVDWVDVEESMGQSDRLTLFTRQNYPCTKIISSCHKIDHPSTIEDTLALLNRCLQVDGVDVVKVVTLTTSEIESIKVSEAVRAVKSRVPVIFLCLGEEGKWTRLLNWNFLPCCSKNATKKAAPGQLSASEVMSERRQHSLVIPLKFWLCGSPISQSPSPAMHNTAFRKIKLPFTYELFETTDFDKFVTEMNKPEFGGASITIPHKQTVIPYMHSLSKSASLIGAVNTVVVDKTSLSSPRKLMGENTDWVGIYRPIVEALQQASSSSSHGKEESVALIYGAGGTSRAACYAMAVELGMDVLVVNPRTPQKAKELARELSLKFNTAGGKGCVSMIHLDQLNDDYSGKPVAVVISTLPAHASPSLPPFILNQAIKPVVLDVVYAANNSDSLTDLLLEAKTAKCPVISGSTMLLEQGVEQSQLWLKRKAPRHEMEEAMHDRLSISK